MNKIFFLIIIQIANILYSAENTPLDSFRFSKSGIRIHYQTHDGSHYVFKDTPTNCALLECYNFAKVRVGQDPNQLPIIEQLDSLIKKEYPTKHACILTPYDPNIQKAERLFLLKKYSQK